MGTKRTLQFTSSVLKGHSEVTVFQLVAHHLFFFVTQLSLQLKQGEEKCLLTKPQPSSGTYYFSVRVLARAGQMATINCKKG